MNTNGKMEIFIDRLIGGKFEVEVDGVVTALRTKGEAASFVDVAIRAAQDLDMFWAVYGQDKLA